MGNFKVASLFSGIGGMCLGFKQAGAEIVWANEIDKFACKTFRHNFPKVKLIEGDICGVSTSSIPDINILTAGFPCQPFSIAGYRRGFSDKRGNVFFEIERILDKKKPEAFLLENVKNLASHDKGRTFQIIKEVLEGQEYFLKYEILNSMEYGDLPQNRERIYIAGFKKKEAYNNFSFPKPINLNKKIRDLIDFSEKKPDKFYYNKTQYYPELKEKVIKRSTVYQIRRVYIRENKSNVCPTLTANMGGGGHNVPIIKDDYDIRKLTPQECLLFQGFPKNYHFPEDLSLTNAYKQTGNTVPVPVVKRIAANMLKALKLFA